MHGELQLVGGFGWSSPADVALPDGDLRPVVRDDGGDRRGVARRSSGSSRSRPTGSTSSAASWGSRRSPRSRSSGRRRSPGVSSSRDLRRAAGRSPAVSQLVPLVVALLGPGGAVVRAEDTMVPVLPRHDDARRRDGSVGISVNGRPHQRIMPLDVPADRRAFRFDAVPARAGQPAHRRAHHRRGQRQRRRHRARRRGASTWTPSRSTRVLYELGRDCTPIVRTRTRASTCTSTTAVRSSRDTDTTLRPDPVRAPGLAHPARRAVVAPPRELPVHGGGDARRSATT